MKFYKSLIINILQKIMDDTEGVSSILFLLKIY
jgi:hypothetical protein